MEMFGDGGGGIDPGRAVPGGQRQMPESICLLVTPMGTLEPSKTHEV